jgi:hypothetical protein
LKRRLASALHTWQKITTSEVASLVLVQITALYSRAVDSGFHDVAQQAHQTGLVSTGFSGVDAGDLKTAKRCFLEAIRAEPWNARH